MMVLILMVMVLVPDYGFAFGDNSYSWAEHQMKHKPLKPVMEQYKVVPEPVVVKDTYAKSLARMKADVGDSVLVAGGVASNLTNVVHREHNSLPLDEKSVAHNYSLPTKASPQELQVVSIETTVDDWQVKD